jgi:hypothetical protein
MARDWRLETVSISASYDLSLKIEAENRAYLQDDAC